MWYLIQTIVLFVLLTPGVVLTLPPGGSKLTVALVHAVVFALAHKFITHGVMGY